MFRFAQRLSTILGDRELTATEQSGLDSYDIELEDALSQTGAVSGGFPNSDTAAVTLYGSWSESATAATPFNKSFTYGDSSNPADPAGASLAGIPADLGLTYVLDNSTPDIIADEAGIWVVEAMAGAGQTGVPDSSPFVVRVWDDASAEAHGYGVWIDNSLFHLATCSIVAHCEAGSDIFPIMRFVPVLTQSVGGIFRVTLTRLK